MLRGSKCSARGWTTRQRLDDCTNDPHSADQKFRFRMFPINSTVLQLSQNATQRRKTSQFCHSPDHLLSRTTSQFCHSPGGKGRWHMPHL